MNHEIWLNLCKGSTSTWIFADKPQWMVDGIAQSLTEVLATLKDRSVCFLVHGYNVPDAKDAYAAVIERIGHLYDEIIQVRWPGSKIPACYWFARMRANKAGQMLSTQLAAVSRVAAVTDAEGHSLGCRVLLEAIRTWPYYDYLRLRNLILAAAAVDNTSVVGSGEYTHSLKVGLPPTSQACLTIAYSTNDKVLRYGFSLGEWLGGQGWDTALGLAGLPRLMPTPCRIYGLNCSGDVNSHGGYKTSETFLRRWEALAK